MTNQLTLAAVLLAATFSNDTSFRKPHGWLHWCASVEEAAALDRITMAGGWASSTGSATKIEVIDQCLKVRERDVLRWQCVYGWVGYEAPRDSTRQAGDPEIALLKDVRHVSEVDLCGTAVSDASLDVLASLPELRVVKVFGTSLSEYALECFGRLRPDVRIDRADPLGSVVAREDAVRTISDVVE